MKAPGTKSIPHFGDVFDITLEPVIGSAIGKTCPCLVVSNDINNEYSSTVTVLPITSQKTKKTYAFEVHVVRETAGLTEDSRIKADQIRSVDKRRLIRYRGSLPQSLYPGIEQALKVHLNMK